MLLHSRLISLYGVRGKRSQNRKVTSKKETYISKRSKNIAEPKEIKEIADKAYVQAATTVMMVFRDADAGPLPTLTANQRKPKRQRHSRVVLEKPLIE